MLNTRYNNKTINQSVIPVYVLIRNLNSADAGSAKGRMDSINLSLTIIKLHVSDYLVYVNNVLLFALKK